jgi:2-polyprenyl-3-methyl-5-hydroxy-6-metoxy-1,4-benzoquinol methylase
MSSLELLADVAELSEKIGPACPLCDEAMTFRTVVPRDWRRVAVAESYPLVWCGRCDYGELADRPTPEQAAAAYDVDNYYTHRRAFDASKHSTEERVSFFDRLRTAIAWRCEQGVTTGLDEAALCRYGVAPGATVCDIGCGNGGLLTRLAGHGYAMTGIEPDPAARQVAQSHGHMVHIGSAESLPFEVRSQCFDAVTMMHVLEHCIEPTTAVRNAASLLNDRGVLIVETPNNACEGARRAGITWRWLDVPRHLNFFTPKSLRRICDEAGLAVLVTEFTGYTRQFKNDWLAEECEIRRRFADTAADSAADPDHAAKSFRAARRAAWRLLGATWAARAERKYDSVRVVAVRR